VGGKDHAQQFQGEFFRRKKGRQLICRLRGQKAPNKVWKIATNVFAAVSKNQTGAPEKEGRVR